MNCGNPLSSIRNSLVTVRETVRRAAIELERPRPDRALGGSLRRHHQRLARIYPRPGPTARRSITADNWLAETLNDQAIPADVVVTRDFGAPGRRARSMPNAWRRVIVNLIDNATQAMGESAGERRIDVSTGVESNVYQLVIADSGPGIPPKFCRVFSSRSSAPNRSAPDWDYRPSSRSSNNMTATLRSLARPAKGPG